jgi:hypothetical protein
MRQANFSFFNPSGNLVDTISFDLLDTDGCRAWQYAVLLNSKNRLIRKGNGPKYTPVVNKSRVDELYQDIVNCIAKINLTEFKFDDTIPPVTTIDQSFLNKLHRHFTSVCEIIWDSKFINFDLRNTLDPILQTLNFRIHQIEIYIPTEHKVSWSNQGNEVVLCAENDALSYDIAPFKHCHTFEHADLILDSHILGKTLIESFMCNDDPVTWDTTGHVRTSGGVSITLNNYRQDIYNSNQFKKWLDAHNTSKDNLCADFPLGNFVSGHKQKLEVLSNDPNFIKYSCKVELLN